MPTFKTTCDECGEPKDAGPYSSEIKYIGDHAICLDCIAFHKYDLEESQDD
jgi:hypothetical protein